MNLKQNAAQAAMEYIRDGMVVGLGTGSTADYFLQALGAAVREGRLRNIVGIPTSIKSEQRAHELGIPLTGFDRTPHIDVTVDGADEVAPDLTVIKGLGGALIREKIVAQNSKRMIVVVDSSKRVQTLGTRCPLPIEVTQFGYEIQESFLQSLGSTPALRRNADGSIFVTDNGNYIFDSKFPSIPDPAGLEVRLARRAGIVGSGLFVGIASVALIAEETRVTKLER